MVMGTEVDTAMVVVLEEVSAAAVASDDEDDDVEDVLTPLAVVVAWLFELDSLVVVEGLSGEEGEVEVVLGV